jgi:signal transduction histidine kinase
MVAAVAAALIASWVAHRLIRPLGALAGTAAAVARGERPAIPHDDSSDEIARVAEAMRVMSDAVAQREQALREQAQRSARLAATSRVLEEAGFDLAAIMQHVVREATEQVGDSATLRVLSADGERLELAAAYHPDPGAQCILADALAAPQPRDAGVSGRVLREGESLLLADVQSDPLRGDFNPALAPIEERLGLHSLLFVPLRARERAVGLLTLLRHTPGRPFTDADRRFAEDLAGRAALAMENARLYRESQDALRARDEFLSIASHELRTPLTALKSAAQLLQRAQQRSILDEERLSRHLRAIVAEGDRLAGLVDDLLDVSRLRTGHLELRPEPLDLAAQARDAADRFRDHLPEGHSLRVRTDGACPVVADRARLDQVLANLLSNAVKYSPGGGPIALTVGPDAGGACLAVRDYGIGLPPGSESAIFEPFGRAENATRQQIQGLGLGLHICREIIQRHGGRIWAESPGEGRGTTVSVWLPCAPD